MNCAVCARPIVLVPSAAERAAKHGKTPALYTGLFTEHTDCTLKKRADDMSAFLAARREATKHINPNNVWAFAQV